MSRLRQILSTTATALALAAPVRAFAQGAPEPAVTLRPGDAVRIAVWRSPEMSGDFEIASDSTIGHPLYREVKAAGVPFDVVEDRIRTVLQRYSSTPQYVALPLLRVAVGGQVRQPGLQTVPPSVTISDVIARAGGATERARMNRVHLVRDGHEQLLDLTLSGQGEQRVRSGDQIFVDTRSSVYRDYIAPAGGLVAAAATVLNIILRR